MITALLLAATLAHPKPAPHLVVVGGHCYIKTTTAQQAQQSPGLDPQSEAQLAYIVGGAAQQVTHSGTVGTVSSLVAGVLGIRHATPAPTPQPPISVISALIENTGSVSSRAATLEVDFQDRVPVMLAIRALKPDARAQISHVVTGETLDGALSCEVQK